jgi:penicillin-binding protein 1A
LLCLAALGAGWIWFSKNILADLPNDLSHLKRWKPPTTCRVYDASSRQLDEFYLERRIWVPIESLPDFVPQALVSAEDRRFYAHEGVDLFGIVRALWVNLVSGHTKQGGSTITQQLVKNLLTGKERSYQRKMREAVLAWRLERELEKEQILELYLNYVYLGAGNYGVEAAARDYFGVPASSLNPGQAALIAGLVPAPSRYSPRLHPDLAAQRREIVLNRMIADGYLEPKEVEDLLDDPVVNLPAGPPSSPIGVAYATQVRRELRRLLGAEWIVSAGLRIDTPLDMRLQATAEAAVARAIDELEKRQAKIAKPGSARLPAEGAAIVMENATGRIKALVGGKAVGLEGFIRATQARRQPGSSFKPYVYAAALLRGQTQLDTVLDAPLSLPGAGGKRWSPSNYDGRFHGEVTLRTALAKSLNTAAVRLVFDAGMDHVARTAQRMGVTTPLRIDPTLALGSSEVTLMDQVRAYGSIARLGVPVDPVFVDRVRNSDGSVIGLAGGPVEGRQAMLPGRPLPRVLPAGVAYELLDMMREVVRKGTARRAHQPDQDRAGKTGTTNDFVDAWFIGFTPFHTVGVWIGTDGHASLGESETGGRAALPAWIEIVDALGEPAGARFPVPDEAVLVRVDEQWIGLARGAVPAQVMRVTDPGFEPLPSY